MKKRIISFTLTSILVFLFLFGQLFEIAVNPQAVSTQSSIRVREISATRGMIYDRNLSPLVNDSYSYISCIKPTTDAAEILSAVNDTESLKTVADGKLLVLPPSETPLTESSDDIKTITAYKRYSGSSLLHILGYTDQSGNGVSGLEKYYNDYLNETGGELSIAYTTDANGRLLLGEPIEIRDNEYYDKDGLVLTIDKNIQAITEAALKKGNIDKGAAIVLDVKTSAIVACASTPVYDRDDLQSYIHDPNTPFINRALSAYPVGSVFKTVTSAAALENRTALSDFNCTGSIEKSGNTFNCNETEGHGVIDFDTALSVSCNPYFIDLGVKVGAKKLLDFTNKAGFGKSADLGNGFLTAAGTLPAERELNSDAAIGNFAFGQGKLTASPLQISSFFAAIANKGIYNEPYLIKGTTDKSGAISPEIQKEGKKIMSESTCNVLKDALLKATREGTGKAAFSSLFDACTKTATAQSGQYDENGNEILYCWFAGFFPYDNPQYVICILKENGSSGGADGGPVFKEISENIYINEQ